VKAVILAGGKGSRGKPFTDYFSKAMIPVNDKPLIEYVTRYITSFSFIDEIIIISDFNGLGGQIKNYLGTKVKNKKITYVQDSQSGTAGDLLHIIQYLKNTSEFLLWFVDNLCAIDVKKMIYTFKQKKSIACIATRKHRKEETGFAVVKNGLITKFKEKPTIKLEMSECLGIYILSTDILKKIKSKKKNELNLSYDILQNLTKQEKVSSFDIGQILWIDVESPIILERNKKLVKNIIKQMEQ